MALKNQPYFPFYVKDWLADSQLKYCSAEAHGVYIYVMCLMHQSAEYGRILHMQKSSTRLDFAHILARATPFELAICDRALKELLHAGVVTIEAGKLCQKRMIRDGELSETRKISGSKKGKNRLNGHNLAHAKEKQNTVIANAYVNASKERKEREGDSDLRNDFEIAHRAYPGRRGGVPSDFAMIEQRADWREIVPKLLPAIEAQIAWRKDANGEFRAPWKDFRNWLDKECWEEEIKTPEPEKIVL